MKNQNENRTLIKDSQGSSFVLFNLWGHRKTMPTQRFKVGPHCAQKPTSNLKLDFPACWNVRNKLHGAHKPPILLVQLKWARTECSTDKLADVQEACKNSLMT